VTAVTVVNSNAVDELSLL